MWKFHNLEIAGLFGLIVGLIVWSDCLVWLQHEVQDIQQQVQGSCFDMEYAIK